MSCTKLVYTRTYHNADHDPPRNLGDSAQPKVNGFALFPKQNLSAYSPTAS